MVDRRTFIKRSGALAAISLASFNGLKGAGEKPGTSRPERILPRRLREGDLIGLVTPASAIKKEQLEATVQKLEDLGFRTTYRESVLSQYGYFAGTDRARAGELTEMFADGEVNGIWCIRGGYGSIRILDRVDFDIIRNNPKVFVGYSDITALHTAIYQETGLVTYHGPLGISEFNRFSFRSLNRVVMEPSDTYRYPYAREKGTRKNPEFDRYTITGGEAEGELAGGNISVLDSMIGTRFEPDFENKVVYLEEIEEKTYRVDKMLFHLLSATNLKKAAGIVMGVMGKCNVNDEPRLTLKEAITGLLDSLGIPVCYGLSFGHIDRMITIPNGIRARMNADRSNLVLLEKTVMEQ